MKNIAVEFDHPCKETCSGWKQGLEKGQMEILKLLRSGELRKNDWPGGEESMTGTAWADWLEKKLGEK